MLTDRNQKYAPLFEALCSHAAESPACLHVPGHRQGRALPGELLSLGGHSLFNLDLTEIPGLDDLHNPLGPIARAQELAAGIYGADRSFFLVNGTTTGLQALILAAVGQKKVIVPRNAHRSVLSGLIISGADPVYVMPEIIPGFGVDCGVSSLGISRVIAENPATAAVLAVHPNYYGVTGDLAGQVRVVHKADMPVMVDEAHGAHLRFHAGLPGDAMAAGADASVQSTHKLGGSLTQSSILHLQGRRMDAGAIAAALRLLQTTSPSYILMASLDLARRQLALQGEKLLGRALELAQGLRERLSRIRGLRILAEEHLPGSSFSLDPTRLVISVQGLGLTGYQVYGLLAERGNVFIEMADAVNIVAIVSIGTTREDCDALAQVLEDIAVRDRLPAGVPPLRPPVGYRKRMKPRDAWFSPARRVPLAEARGRICAEAVAVYPPGIPAVAPGEEITPEVHEYLTAVGKLGLPCQGPSDPTLKTIKVVIE